MTTMNPKHHMKHMQTCQKWAKKAYSQLWNAVSTSISILMQCMNYPCHWHVMHYTMHISNTLVGIYKRHKHTCCWSKRVAKKWNYKGPHSDLFFITSLWSTLILSILLHIFYTTWHTVNDNNEPKTSYETHANMAKMSKKDIQSTMKCCICINIHAHAMYELPM